MRSRLILMGLLMLAASASLVRAQALVASDPICDTTVPNGVVAGAAKAQRWSYGNSLLSLGPFGLWPEGTVVFRPGGAGFTTLDGSLGMKFGWTRGVPGALSVSGRRLDAPAPPLRFETTAGYGDVGFQPSYLIFSSPGCWEVTAQIATRGDSRLVFITKVVKLGEGPAVRGDHAGQ